MISKREILFASVSGLTALIAILTMPLLVARPKLLFGRSLSAISPTLFPYLILSLIAALSAGLIFVAYRQLKSNTEQHRDSTGDKKPHTIHREDTVEHQVKKSEENDWLKKGAFFIILAGYGLMLKPLGFLISSFIVISATSLMLGNRHWLQIGLLAVVSPVCLYLVATRAMLVSLPELNRIELFYAHLIAWIQGSGTS